MELSSDLVGRAGGDARFDSRLAQAISTKLPFLLRKNPWGRCFGCGKRPCGHGDTHPLFLMHRNSFEEQYSEVRTADWGGPGTWNREVTGLIPSSCKSLLGHLLVVLESLSYDVWKMLGSVW